MRPLVVLGLGLLFALALWADHGPSAPAGRGESPARPAPEFPRADPEGWINSPPLSMTGLRGRVVVLDVWTFG